MRIGIQTWGSEGDIRPFLALGHALAARGHRVEMVYTDIGERSYDAVAAGGRADVRAPSGTPNLGEIGNIVEWKLARFMLNRVLLPNINRFRANHGLPPCDDLLDDAWPSHRLNLQREGACRAHQRSATHAGHEGCGDGDRREDAGR